VDLNFKLTLTVVQHKLLIKKVFINKLRTKYARISNSVLTGLSDVDVAEKC